MKPFPKCLKCEGNMEQGFIADATHGGVLTSKWMAGAPERGWFGGVKTRGKKKVEITTYRCTVCGYLESYAK